jgi:hypothetical protein
MMVFSPAFSASGWLVDDDICCGIARPSVREGPRVFLQTKSGAEDINTMRDLQFGSGVACPRPP